MDQWIREQKGGGKRDGGRQCGESWLELDIIWLAVAT